MTSQKLESFHGVIRLKNQEAMEFKTAGNTCWKVCVLRPNCGFDHSAGRYLLPVEVVFSLLGWHSTQLGSQWDCGQ